MPAKLPDDTQRDQRVTFVLSREEREDLRRAMKEQKFTNVSEFIRYALKSVS